MRQRRARHRATSAAVSARKRTVMAGLCVSMLLPHAGMGEPVAARSRGPAKHDKVPVLTEAQRTRHALRRFTFGPRPGEASAVDRMGRDAWFERQLHPERIADDALAARLAQFPAMQLTQAELLARFPSPQRLRQYSRGAGGSGQVQAAVGMSDALDGQVEQAIYQDAAWKYVQKAADAAQAPSTLPITVMSITAAAPATPVFKAPFAETQAILELHPAERLARLVSLSPAEMQSFRDGLKGPDQQRLLEGFSPVQAEQVTGMQAPERVVDTEVMATRLLRDVYSERQLQAVMTDFWLNHFNVYARKNQDEPYLLPAYEQKAVLPHALGRFEDLLVAVAESPAMLLYLDNWTSIGPRSAVGLRANRPGAGGAAGKPAAPKGINENYARELLELHTLGVNGGYTQRDVEEVAKCFTGWTIEKPAEDGSFRFDPKRHEPGAKFVLGQVIPEGGEDEGLAVLHLLASSPATAHLLSLQLAERFVSDTPPPALVDRMATAYLKSDGEIAAVLRVLYRSPEFWAPAVYEAKMKTPLEFVVSAVRASHAEISRPMPLVQVLNKLGMPLYGMATPNGYSWQSDAWVSSNALLNRMNFALTLSANKLQGTKPDWPGALGSLRSPLMHAPESSAGDQGREQALEALLLGRPASLHTHAAVLAEVNATAAPEGDAQARRDPGTRMAEVVPTGVMTTGQGGRSPEVLPLTLPKGRPTDLPEGGTAAMAGLLLGSPEFQRR